MTTYKVCVIGGWCGNRMVMVADHLARKLAEAGYPCSIRTFNAWENYTQPPAADLILQLLPAFTQAETGCLVLNVRPLLADIDDSKTIAKILEQVRADYPA
ncbi:MAG: hypothetical protein FJZ87_02640 [Chloroflexi bacterium]|nr:hypothetical protein [Chloroflexota bacterium]